MSKKLFIWAVAHLVVASWVADEMRKQGKDEQEAQLAGHAAGAVAALVLTSAI